jgi:mono/diheme cytochrome c family protein
MRVYAVAGALLGAIAVLPLGACESKPLTPVERGRQVYMVHCVQCHNPDPASPGTQGPEIAGASRELIEARVLHVSYPPGYKPKRTTHGMKAIPHLASRIDDLTAFLAEAAHRQGK